MDFDAKLTAALERLCATGMRRYKYAPPLYRLLWRLGVKLPPPHFVRPVFHFIFGFVWAALLIEVPHIIDHSRIIIVVPAVTGVIVGLIMACSYANGARQHGLPSWSEFKP